MQFEPETEQEKIDQERSIAYSSLFPDTILTRENTLVHLTASGLIFNKKKTKVLMVHHNIYQTWTWTGGHTDGETDLLKTACKEAVEETGCNNIKPITSDILSLAVLAVQGHFKNGSYMSAHLHISAGYGLWADENSLFTNKPDENSGVRWIALEDISSICKEPHMQPIYQAVIKRALRLKD